MKQRYQKREPQDEKEVRYLVEQGVPLAMAEAMNARGVCQRNFSYYCNEECFHSPFEMKNMSEAVDTLSYILEEGGSVLICGDYDADGLTASSVLSLFFSDNGIENDVIIPTREMGYGLHAETVIEAFQKKYYDLIITVDCGISNKEEVETIIEELGAEVIVTDHHELPEELPPCVCVNPKLGYPFPYLSGSGVAWKLVEALVGRDAAANYAELAMIGTIGDLMPLEDENRSLVKLGLANKNHKSLKKLAEISKCSKELTASDIALRIAPRINAAGRMGQPNVALELLLSRDKVSAATDKLTELNELRKQAIADLTAEADGMCDIDEIKKNRMVFLYSDSWHHGILGIAAARYKEKYGFPAVVLTKDDNNNFVGSARGVDDVDLFDVFCQCKDLLLKFGGHKAAVGFSVSEQNLLLLKQKLSQIFNLTDEHCFKKHFYYDIDLSEGAEIAEMFKFTQRMEPLLPQNKIVFRVRDHVKTASSFGRDNAHLSMVLGSGLELKAFFKYSDYAPFVRKGADVEALVTLEYDDYNKRICGTTEDMHLCNSVCFDGFYKYNFLKNFQPRTVESVSKKAVEKILSEKKVLAVFDDFETYLKMNEVFDFSEFCEDIFFDTDFADKTVAISPNCDYGFEKYPKIVCFCKQGAVRQMPQNAVYFCVEAANEALYSVELNRDLCVAAYSRLKHKDEFDSVKAVYDKYLVDKMSYETYLVALRVFEQLNFIKITDNFTVEILPSSKVDLTESSVYNYFASKQN